MEHHPKTTVLHLEKMVPIPTLVQIVITIRLHSILQILQSDLLILCMNQTAKQGENNYDRRLQIRTEIQRYD